MIILGIDPGYGRLGIAVIEHTKNGDSLLYSDCIQTSPKTPHEKRLAIIGEEITKIIENWKPDCGVLETLFFNTNQKTAMRVAEARGVVVYEIARNDIPVFEYTPLQVKIAVTSYGRSDKTQVTEMLKKLVKIDKNIKYDDEYDAIAVALTHAVSYKSPI